MIDTPTPVPDPVVPNPILPAVPMSSKGEVIVSSVVVIGFIAILVMLIVRPIALEEKVVSILQILVGTLAAKFGDVVQYHIGSSAGSKAKDAVIASATKGS